VPKTDTSQPDYYHKVVDCQWACPAHTNVPEYIRLIAEGRYADAYMVNRESNVFPGILGRVCDRPCEPACRRGRLPEDKPVAICRLKRVAADHRGDISARLPKAPKQTNGKRVALIGAGPASLTVANDLLPLGYEVVVYEKEKKAGGAMRSQVPGFRLPEDVLDEETQVILGMGATVHYETPVTSLRALLGEGFDAVFVGTGAPLGRDLKIPGREDVTTGVHIGVDWLAGVAFGHVTAIGKRVVVIGGGNTAMDCCRTARRVGGRDIQVIAPEAYSEMLASPWEIEDAEGEGMTIRNHLLPIAFESREGRLTGVRFQKVERVYDANKRWDPKPTGDAPIVVECDEVILAIGQNTAYPFVERDLGIGFDDRGLPAVHRETMQSGLPQIFFGGDAAFGPKNIIWAVAHGHEAAISIHQYLSGQDLMQRPAKGMNLSSQKMGMHEWSYGNEYSAGRREHVPHAELALRLENLHLEVELGFDEAQAAKEAARCLNCDVQTVFSEPLCIECDACVDICPINCLTFTADGTVDDLRTRLNAPANNLSQALLISNPLETGRVMVKDEDLCIHCGLCAERCPTAAWDMQKFTLQLKKAGEA